MPFTNTYTSNGTITEHAGSVSLDGTSALTLTLAHPATDGSEDGNVLTLVNSSGKAHTVALGGVAMDATFSDSGWAQWLDLHVVKAGWHVRAQSGGVEVG